MTTVTKDRSTIVSFIIAILLAISSTWVWVNNDYSTYRDVPVTFIDKFAQESCHKGSCHDRFIGLFRTDEGVIFDRPISAYMFRQMHLQEKFTLNLRPFDIKQTPMDNVFWLFGPMILHIVTVIFWLFMIYSVCDDWYTSRKAKK